MASGKGAKRSAVVSRSKRAAADEVMVVDDLAVPTVKKQIIEPLKAQNSAQERYINAIKNFDLVFGVGPAGTGKTYIAGALAAQMLEARRFERIIVTRPAVEAGESLGFLPGELDEKYEPYIAPFRDVLNERLGVTFVDYLVKTKRIVPIPLGYMRGRSFNNSIVILDEAQNTTPKQMKMFLTRIGRNCKAIVDGDLEQVDLSGLSGLADAVRRLDWIPNVKTVRFTVEDVVRSGLVQDILKSYGAPLPPVR